MRRPPFRRLLRTFERAYRLRPFSSMTTAPRTTPLERSRAAGAVTRSEPLRGKGNVVRRMFADVEADVFVLVDGDDTYDAGIAAQLVDTLLKNCLDMVNGARQSTAQDAYRPGHRFGNRVLTGMVATFFGSRIMDLLSGYRVFSRRFVKSFPALASGFEIETELSVHALQLRMPLTEVLTTYKERPRGSISKLNTYKDGFRIFRTIVYLIKEEKPFAFFSFIAILARRTVNGTRITGRSRIHANSFGATSSDCLVGCCDSNIELSELCLRPHSGHRESRSRRVEASCLSVNSGALSRYRTSRYAMNLSTSDSVAPQFLRFALVGAIGFVIDVGVLYLALALFPVGPYAGRVISYMCAATSTWYLHRRITFRNRPSQAIGREWLKFVVLNGVGGLLNYATYVAYLHYFAGSTFTPAIGVALGSAAGLSINYTLSRRVVFRAPFGSPAEPAADS
jgi:putative flippase GtrA